MAQALYREWRPRDFDEVVEQEHVVSALRQAVITGELGHAYLFAGTRGTGKTTMAKLMAKAVNCLHPQDGNPDNSCEICLAIQNNTLTDVAEIDAASNNSVDNIRQITEEIVFLPARARYKVYIIDEVHMLSTGAFNALLKTLEEPPGHAIFILATTEPHRLPATILSRCQRFDFRRISEKSIAERLRRIADAENIRIDAPALRAIAQLADGAMRDAISLLDQAKISFPAGASEADIRSMTGQVDRAFLGRLTLALIKSDVRGIMEHLDEMIREGQDIVRFCHELASFYRDLLIIHAAGDVATLGSGSLESLIHASDAEIADLKTLAAYYQQPEVVERITQLSTLISDMRWSPNPRILLEVTLLRLMGTRAGQTSMREQQKQLPPARVPETILPAAPVPAGGPAESQAAATATAAASAAARTVSPGSGSADAVPAAERSGLQPPVMHEQPDESDPETEDEPEPFFEEEPDYLPPEPDEVFYDEEALQQEPVSPEPAADSTSPLKTEPEYSDTARESAQAPPAAAGAASLSVEPAVQVRDRTEALKIWTDVLKTLQRDDMFCYLFARTAEVDAKNGGLSISFASDEKANYNVFQTDRGKRPLREAIRSSQGHMLPFEVWMRGTADGRPEESQGSGSGDWQNRVMKTAKDLGIPIERKEE